MQTPETLARKLFCMLNPNATEHEFQQRKAEMIQAIEAFIREETND